MSIYCHLCCVDCREIFHVKDADSKVYVNRGEKWDAYTDPLSQFLEKHSKHPLRYLWEDDEVETEKGWECPSEEWPRFKSPENGHWSHGLFLKDHRAELLASCERRAIEIYYAAPPEKLAGECRAELVAEFGEDVVAEMLRKGIGNNGGAFAEADTQSPEPKALPICPAFVCAECGHETV
jgi:hypothetical protein